MDILNARQLHNETSAVLDAVEQGRIFAIRRAGKIIGKLTPTKHKVPGWDDIMREVNDLRDKAPGDGVNLVLADRARRRR